MQVLLCKTFIFVQTNIYIKTYTSMKISSDHQDKTMVSDNFKRNHFNPKKVECEFGPPSFSWNGPMK